MGRNSKQPPDPTAPPSKSLKQLQTLLEESIDFLKASALAYDNGIVHEAKRLATTVRVLMHETKQSHALLVQMKLRDKLKWADTGQPIDPMNLLPTIPGLVIMKVTVGIGGEYVAPLDDRPDEFLGRTKDFHGWWNDPVSRFPDATWCRKDYVLALANKEGGAHVDPSLTPRYDDLVRNNLLGWSMTDIDGVTKPFEGNAAYAAVRQITHEVLATLPDSQVVDAAAAQEGHIRGEFGTGIARP